MEKLFPELTNKQQRGSKPRCHLLTNGTREEVARRLTSLIEPWGQVRANDQWMPRGFADCTEVQLHTAAGLIAKPHERSQLRDWWLATGSGQTTTPNIDIASTCLVQGEEGLLLVEAMAHDEELRIEERGKPLAGEASAEGRRNHRQIGLAIQAANASLAEATELPWALSRDSHYQISNRFAWSWKMTGIGKPVILVYLGFLDCEEMNGFGQRPIASLEEWTELVTTHTKPLFPSAIWNREWRVHERSFIPLIRTVHEPLSRS